MFLPELVSETLDSNEIYKLVDTLRQFAFMLGIDKVHILSLVMNDRIAKELSSKLQNYD